MVRFWCVTAGTEPQLLGDTRNDSTTDSATLHDPMHRFQNLTIRHRRRTSTYAELDTTSHLEDVRVPSRLSRFLLPPAAGATVDGWTPVLTVDTGARLGWAHTTSVGLHTSAQVMAAIDPRTAAGTYSEFLTDVATDPATYLGPSPSGHAARILAEAVAAAVGDLTAACTTHNIPDTIICAAVEASGLQTTFGEDLTGLYLRHAAYNKVCTDVAEHGSHPAWRRAGQLYAHICGAATDMWGVGDFTICAASGSYTATATASGGGDPAMARAVTARALCWDGAVAAQSGPGISAMFGYRCEGGRLHPGDPTGLNARWPHVADLHIVDAPDPRSW